MKLNKDKNLLCYSLNDFYTKYKKERTDVRHLTLSQYSRILKKVFFALAQRMIETTIPYNPKVGIGRFGIVKRKSKKSIDFFKTKLYKKVIYHTNNHTNGFYYRWFWEKRTAKCNFKNRQYYSFHPVPNLKKRLSKHIIELSKDPFKKSFDCLSQLPPYENEIKINKSVKTRVESFDKLGFR